MEWCFGGEADRPWQVALLLLGARNDHLSTSERLVGCNKSCSQQRRAGDTAHCAQSPTLVSASRDRRSVVSGKSVSVRVDLGGSRSIKKKTQLQNTSRNDNK